MSDAMVQHIESSLRDLGRQLLTWRREGVTAHRQEGTQFKADVDRCAHEALVTLLARVSPGTPVVSEEDPASFNLDRSFPYWLLDPLDGTASFIHGFDGFVTQLALIDERGPRLAFVYAPSSDEMFTAARGAGAAMNGRALSCRATGRDALVDNYPEPRGIAAAAMRALGFRQYVESGSIGLKICRVAGGQADVFLKDVPVRDWDLAPGDLILSEAGGCLTSLRGDAFSYSGNGTHTGIVAATTSQWHQRVVDWAEAHWVQKIAD